VNGLPPGASPSTAHSLAQYRRAEQSRGNRTSIKYLRAERDGKGESDLTQRSTDNDGGQATNKVAGRSLERQTS